MTLDVFMRIHQKYVVV
jgi:hypothetical protein